MWGGLTSPRELRAIADVVEKYEAPMVKVTGGQRLHRPSDYEQAIRARGGDPSTYDRQAQWPWQPPWRRPISSCPSLLSRPPPCPLPRRRRLIQTQYGDLATCQARQKLNCLNALKAPGTTATPAQAQSCGHLGGAERALLGCGHVAVVAVRGEPRADGVEVFEREASRIDFPMTHGAALIRPVLVKLLANRDGTARVGLHRRDGRGRHPTG